MGGWKRPSLTPSWAGQHDAARSSLNGRTPTSEADGCVTTRGRFVDRFEAEQIANRHNQAPMRAEDRLLRDEEGTGLLAAELKNKP